MYFHTHVRDIISVDENSGLQYRYLRGRKGANSLAVQPRTRGTANRPEESETPIEKGTVSPSAVTEFTRKHDPPDEINFT